MKTAIIGSGSWGSALGELLVENGHETIIYGRDPAQIEDLNKNHKNSRYFPADITFDNALTGTTDLEKAVDRQGLRLSSRFLRKRFGRSSSTEALFEEFIRSW
jgi:glycerol-3-phosphate dehydrogenase (NAD(P)+)